MTALDDLPDVGSFFGVDLRTGSMIIAALGIDCGPIGPYSLMSYFPLAFSPWLRFKFGVHPMAYGCTFFIPLSYLLVTIWILVALFFAASIVLFCGLVKEDPLLCAIWIWYTVIFVVVMLMMMMLLAIVFTSRKQRNRVLIVILGMLWYILTIYFILVVNSHRKQLDSSKLHEDSVS